MSQTHEETEEPPMMTSHVIWADSPVKEIWREDRVAQLLLYSVRVSFLLAPPRDPETRFRMGRDGVLQGLFFLRGEASISLPFGNCRKLKWFGIYSQIAIIIGKTVLALEKYLYSITCHCHCHCKLLLSFATFVLK